MTLQNTDNGGLVIDTTVKQVYEDGRVLLDSENIVVYAHRTNDTNYTVGITFMFENETYTATFQAPDHTDDLDFHIRLVTEFVQKFEAEVDIEQAFMTFLVEEFFQI